MLQWCYYFMYFSFLLVVHSRSNMKPLEFFFAQSPPILKLFFSVLLFLLSSTRFPSRITLCESQAYSTKIFKRSREDNCFLGTLKCFGQTPTGIGSPTTLTRYLVAGARSGVMRVRTVRNR